MVPGVDAETWEGPPVCPLVWSDNGFHTFGPQAVSSTLCTQHSNTLSVALVCVHIHVTCKTFLKLSPLGAQCTLDLLFCSAQFCSRWRQYGRVVRNMASDARLPGFEPGLTPVGTYLPSTGPSVLICKTGMATVSTPWGQCGQSLCSF